MIFIFHACNINLTNASAEEKVQSRILDKFSCLIYDINRLFQSMCVFAA